VKAAQEILDDEHYGLEKIKERILEYLAVKQLNPALNSQILCLVGPPGTGKTSIASSLAHAMNRKYVRVSLGGIRDEADIRGHRKTYIGSMPGRIVNALVQAKVKNPLILLDEIDKLTRDSHGDPASALLEVLDSEQNQSFRDHFIEMPIDLSDCIFVATANTTDTIPRPLLDRMETLHLSSYTREEKLQIALRHLLPKQRKRHGLSASQIRIKEDAIYALIDSYTAEAGVRQLERTLAGVCRKVAKGIVDGDYRSKTVSAKNIAQFVSGHPIPKEKVFDTDPIGVVNGLAYTEVGGDLLRIEASAMPGSGKVQLTGSLGDVMKESAQAAVSYIRAHAEELDIAKDFYKEKDLHIHVPEGAVPKDGPSAGVTMVTALVSELSQKPVRRDVAMTGEVTLRGRVLPIGGLKEKTMAAYQAGVKCVLIPKENTCDLKDLDPTVRKAIEFVPCNDVTDVLKVAIVR
jgi:ATP-dependent Lon protease